MRGNELQNNRKKHKSRSIRLKGYDYSQPGAYFVTICTKDRRCLFGDVIDGEVRLNSFGRIVEEEWLRSAEIRSEIKLDAWVVMPNHIHGIVFITRKSTVGATGQARSPCIFDRAPLHATRSARGPEKRSPGSFISGLKATVTRLVNQLRGTRGSTIWQRNYYDRIIRNEEELKTLRGYVAENPLQWEVDQYFVMET
jgi:REP element-mobilizing transposase RayT